MSMLTVVIADDHPHEVKGFTDLLEFAPGIKVVGQAYTAPQAVRQVIDKKPNVILLDLVWIKSKDEGITAIQQIRQAVPDTRILAMTNYDEDMIKLALEAGADKAISKNDLGGIEALTNQIQAAYEARDLPRVVTKPYEKPTDRELEVLAWMCEGLQDKEIAEKLVLSPKTVKRHAQNIYGKLGVRNRSEAVTFALKNRLQLPKVSGGQAREA